MSFLRRMSVLFVLAAVLFAQLSCSQTTPEYPALKLHAKLYSPVFSPDDGFSEGWKNYYDYQYDDKSLVTDVSYPRGFVYDFVNENYIGNRSGQISPLDVLEKVGIYYPQRVRVLPVEDVIDEAIENDKSYFDELTEIIKAAPYVFDFQNMVCGDFSSDPASLVVKNADINSILDSNNLCMEIIFNELFGVEDKENALRSWALTRINGKSCVEAVLDFLDVLVNSSEHGFKCFFDTYDEGCYEAYAWEHEAYEARESMRMADMAVTAQSVFLLSLYYRLAMEEERDMNNELSRAIAYSDEVKIMLLEHPVKHSVIPTCQIKGAEYYFPVSISGAEYQTNIHNFSGAIVEEVRDEIMRDQFSKGDFVINNDIFNVLLDYYNRQGGENIDLEQIIRDKGKVKIEGSVLSQKEKFFIIDSSSFSRMKRDGVCDLQFPARKFVERGVDENINLYHVGDLKVNLSDGNMLIVTWNNYDTSKTWYIVTLKPVNEEQDV